MSQGEKILGILGGMGPAATMHFYEKVVKETRARCDQEHLHVIIDCNCKIPDRTLCIERKNVDFLLETLKESARRLAMAGAEIIAVPCVTAHVGFNELQNSCPVEILNIIKETHQVFQRSGYERPALLATAGTISARLYQDEFREFDVILPEPDQAQKIHAAIMHIKSGHLNQTRSAIKKVIASYEKRGADSLLIGCTDIPLIFAHNQSPLPVFDGTEVLARTAVLRCRDRDW